MPSLAKSSSTFANRSRISTLICRLIRLVMTHRMDVISTNVSWMMSVVSCTTESVFWANLNSFLVVYKTWYKMAPTHRRAYKRLHSLVHVLILIQIGFSPNTTHSRDKVRT
uniref:Uncharacterized protein n=1 Tax=Cacopsylla melanoneura TaxID=428564 RepID=A0A8D9E2D3_9HEMI